MFIYMHIAMSMCVNMHRGDELLELATDRDNTQWSL